MSAVEKIATAGAGVKNLAIGLAVIAAGVAVGYVVFKGYKAAKAVKEAAGEAWDYTAGIVGKDLNPASEENLVNRAAHEALGSDGSWSIGTKLYDWLN
jgi:uncharacterized membrane protein YebE (DUF533 family)